MKNEKDFHLFYEVVKKASGKINSIAEPSLPRKRKRPNYASLVIVEGYDSNQESFNPNTPVEYFKQIYFKALDGPHYYVHQR